MISIPRLFIVDIIDKGGDWEKRNRFAVLSGLAAIMKRDIPKATKLFLQTVKTFTSYDIITYDDFARYTCILSMLTLNRKYISSIIFPFP